jgi:APA family basic amino acid/polyamine antiporter
LTQARAAAFSSRELGVVRADKRKVSLLTATCIVIANMVGTGIFTSLGFQVGDLPSGFAIVVLWSVGGLCALCGALCYAELGPRCRGRAANTIFCARSIIRQSVSRGLGLGTVGFAAPVAIAAMPFGTYLAELVPGTSPVAWGLAVVWVTTLVLLLDIRLGSAFQIGSTLLKWRLIGVIIAAGFYIAQTQPITFLPVKGDGALIVSAPFAVSLYWVMFAYSGWNASTYITGEVRNPSRNIPLSLGLGTLLVTGALHRAERRVHAHERRSPRWSANNRWRSSPARTSSDLRAARSWRC